MRLPEDMRIIRVMHNQRNISLLISAVAALVVLGFGGHEVVKQSPKADVNTGAVLDESYPEVYEVVDGDTIKVTDGAVKKTVRFIGMDTPETKDPRKPVQYFGHEASQYTADLLLHRHVTLKKDVSETDKYGRLLRYVYLGDGTFVNEKLVREGYAHVLTYPPDVKYADLFVAAERDARENKRGLWKD